MKKFLSKREIPIMLFTILTFILFSVISSNFLTLDNMSLILTQTTTVGIISIGMVMVILFGGIDLSVGSILALVATTVGILVNNGLNPWLAAMIGLVIGAICGAFNGYLIAKLNIPDIIVTLASMYIFRGIAVTVSGGTWVTNFPEGFRVFGLGSVLGIPFPVLLTVLLALLFRFILQETRFGRKVYAIGGNLSAAKLAGMNIFRVKFLVYIYSGILCAIVGAIYAARVGSIQASTVASNLSFDAIAAVLIGGGSIFGGIGTVVGTMLGALLLGIIKNGLVLSKVSVYWIDATTGLLIILAVVLNTLQRRRELKRKEEKLI